MIPAEERIVFLLTFFVIETREVEKIVTVTPCFTACYSLYFYIHLLFDLDAFALKKRGLKFIRSHFWGISLLP